MVLRIVLETLPAILLYFYLKRFVGQPLGFTFVSILHFLPFILFLSVFLLFGEDVPFRYFQVSGAWVFGIQFIAYPLAGLSILRAMDTRSPSMERYFNPIVPPRFRWLKTCFWIAVSHGLIRIGSVVLTYWNIDIAGAFEKVNLLIFTMISFFLVYIFLKNPQIIHNDGLDGTGDSAGASGPRYRLSTLSREQGLEIMRQMNGFMEKVKPYLDPDLTLVSLAKQLNLSVHVISEVMNTIINQNFYDYVNNYRVEEFKRLASNPGNNHLKLLALAYNAGFKSKTTFNTAFKKFTGQTPSQYRDSTDY
jgi:AraC-like DNA-binding protein